MHVWHPPPLLGWGKVGIQFTKKNCRELNAIFGPAQKCHVCQPNPHGGEGWGFNLQEKVC